MIEYGFLRKYYSGWRANIDSKISEEAARQYG